MGVREAVKKTIRYAHLYNCTLTFEELEQRLVSEKACKSNDIADVLRLKEFRKLVKDKNDNPNLVEKVVKAKKLAKIIAIKFGSVRFIGLTGSVAARHPNENDDIDLLIITKKDTLWLTRLTLRVFIFISKIPHRVYGKKQNKDEFCFNLWLDEEALLLPSKKQNLKNALDLVMMIPLINKNNTYERFIGTNCWAKKFMATGYVNLINRWPMVDGRKNEMAGLIKIWILKIGNYLLFWPQYLYMKRKIRNETVNLKQAFFHKN